MGHREVKRYQGMLQGSMTEKEADTLITIKTMNKIDGLEHCIYNFSEELQDEAEQAGVNVRKYLNNDLEKYKGTLRNYQTTGVAFMYYSKRSMIGDQVGMGKTAIISGLLNTLKHNGELKGFLIAVESSAIKQTRREIQRFTGFRVVEMPAEAPKIKRFVDKNDWSNTDGVIVRHSTLRSETFVTWLAGNTDPETGKSEVFNTFILDESSVVKNKTSKIYKYTEAIANTMDRMHMMNATSFEMHLSDISNQMRILLGKDAPSDAYVKDNYCKIARTYFWTKRYGVAKRMSKWDVVGYKNQDIYKQELGLVYMGRSRQDVGMDIMHTHLVYTIDLSAKQRAALESQIGRSEEILNCPSMIENGGMSMTREDCPKMDRLCELMSTELSGTQTVIYVFHKDAQAAIAQELTNLGRKVGIINGETEREDIYQIQKQFNNKEIDTVITNIKKSLNLQAGEVCVFYSMISNPAAMSQMAGRIDRGQKVAKTYIMLMYNDSRESEMFTAIVKDRAKHAREFTLDVESTADLFVDFIQEELNKEQA